MKVREEFRSWDVRVTDALHVLDKPGTLRRLAILFGHSGDSWFWLAVLLVIALFGDEARRPWAFTFIGAILVLALLVMAIKFTVRRRRPEGEWGQLYRRTDPHSFPSGHAARAIMLAVLMQGYGPPWLAVTLIIWAPLVALARVATGLHYISDVVAGALLGGLVGLVVLQFNPFL